MGEFSNQIFARTYRLEIPKYKSSIPPPAPAEQPADGLTRIKGSGASPVTLNHSESENHTRSVMRETQRTYDEVRVKNPDDPSQHVDVQRPRKVNFESDEDDRRHRNVTDMAPGYNAVLYAKEVLKDNIEIIRENVVQKNEGGSAAP